MSSIHYPEYQKIIDALIDLREKANLSQSELSRSIGLTQPDVSKIERCERRIDILETIRWVRATGASPIEFVSKILSSEDNIP